MTWLAQRALAKAVAQIMSAAIRAPIEAAGVVFTHCNEPGVKLKRAEP